MKKGGEHRASSFELLIRPYAREACINNASSSKEKSP